MWCAIVLDCSKSRLFALARADLHGAILMLPRRVLGAAAILGQLWLGSSTRWRARRRELLSLFCLLMRPHTIYPKRTGARRCAGGGGRRRGCRPTSYLELFHWYSLAFSHTRGFHIWRPFPVVPNTHTNIMRQRTSRLILMHAPHLNEQEHGAVPAAVGKGAVATDLVPRAFPQVLAHVQRHTAEGLPGSVRLEGPHRESRG